MKSFGKGCKPTPGMVAGHNVQTMTALEIRQVIDGHNSARESASIGAKELG